MRRPRRALLAIVPLALVLSGCGARSATQDSVRKTVRNALLDREQNDNPPTAAVASAIADCVARGMFEGDFSREERDDITHALDGDAPPSSLVARVDELFSGCEEQATAESATSGSTTETTDGGSSGNG